jgi:exopolysaccharide biosynthesis WecB/TagA/CpsF family protein
MATNYYQREQSASDGVISSDVVVFETIELAGVPFAKLGRQDTAKLILRLAKSARRLAPWIATSANGHVLSVCAGDPLQMARLRKADLVSCDGQPIVAISRMLSSQGLHERVATTDLIHDICAYSETIDFTIFLLGSTPTENASARRRLVESYPQLKIVGSTHGYHADHEWPGVIQEVNNLGPDLLVVSLGVPLEQAFYERYSDQLSRVGVIKTAGGLLNFLSGSNPRAPQWMQNAGFEWAFRLALEPRRLFRRYLYTNLHALYLLLSRKPVHDRVSLDVR